MIKTHTLITLILLISFFGLPVTFAQNSELEETDVKVSTTMVSQKPQSEGMRKDIQIDSVERMENVKDNRSQIREAIKQKQEDLKLIIQEKREKATTARESIREEFKLKLAELIDQKKAEIIDRVDTRLVEKNQRVTERLLGHLDSITRILDKMEDKLEQANGGDTSTITALIASARTAVSTAQTAVASQVGNVYLIEIGDETELKNVVKTTVDQFRTDMEIAIVSVKEAHIATQNVAKELGRYREANPPANTLENEDIDKGESDGMTNDSQ